MIALKWPEEATDWLLYFCKTYPSCENSDEVVDVKLCLGNLKSNISQNEEKDKRADNVLSDVEKQLRNEARDYEYRFVGHCNTTTDIKEANFLGK